MLNMISGVAVTPRGLPRFDLPEDFPWQPDFTVYKRGAGFTADYDGISERPTGTEVWIAQNGSNTTGDGSEDAPYRTIHEARQHGNIIMIKAGFYEDDAAAYNMAVEEDSAYIAAEGPGSVIWSANQDNISWSLYSGNVYSATFSSTVNDVLDLTYPRAGYVLKDGFTGLPLPYSEQSSTAAVEANPGSFYYTGTTLYVHTHDSRVPDDDIKPMWNKSIWDTTGVSKTLYLEGIEFWGADALSIYGHATSETSKVIAIDCAFRFAPDGGNARCDSIKEVRFVRCVVSDSGLDGFKYTNNSTSFTQRIAEIECVAERCGRTAGGADNNNCSTGHKDCNIIRVGGIYDTAQGPIIADVQGAQSLNLGVSASNSNSNAGDADVSDAGFNTGTLSADSIPSRMWLFGCRSSGCGFDRTISTGGTMISDADFSGSATDGGNVVIAYEEGYVPATFDDLTLWYDFSDDATIDLDLGIVAVNDKSARRANARQNTSGFRLPAPAVVSGKFNERKVTSPSDRTEERSLDVQSTITLGDVYIVASYDDGAASSFETYNTLISGTGVSGFPRVMGAVGTADLTNSGNDMNTSGVSIDGASLSTSVLPLGFSIIRATPSSPQSDDYTLFRHSIQGSRGWTGDIAEVLVFETEKDSNEDAAIRAYLSNKWGI